MDNAHVNFALINQAVQAHAAEFCQKLLPGGRIVGNEYVTGDLQGGPGNSCRVCLTSGKWADFAGTKRGGDFISLFAAKNGVTQVEAARELAHEYGVTSGGAAHCKAGAPANPLHITPAPADAPERPAAHPRYGRPSMVWTYRDAESRILLHVYRFDPAGGKKQVLPVTLWQDARGILMWHFKGYPEPRPLYGLDQLAKLPLADPVIIPEGEKAADAAGRLVPGAVPMTWPGGGKAVSKANFTPLAGRRVTIWPDADKPGFEAALDVAVMAKQAGAVDVAIVPPPDGVTPGWDLADAESEGWDEKRVVAHIQSCTLDVDAFEALARERFDINIKRKAEAPEPDAASAVCSPEPLRRALPAPEPFPINALGEVLSAAAQALAEVIKAPTATCGQSVLAAASLAVQPHGDVEIDGRVSPTSENFVSVGESGARKSAVDQVALWPHRKHEKSLSEKYIAELEDYKIKLAAHKKSRDIALAKGRTYEERQEGLRALGPEPDAPLAPIIITEDPTLEGLVKLLAIGQPSMGLFSDEGGRMVGGYGMSADNQLKTAAGLSGLWDGKAIDRVRGMDGASKIYGRRVSMHLMMQPNVAGLLLGNDLLAGQGLLARCLTVFPESTAGTRFYNPVDMSQHAAIRRYSGRMLDILEMPLPLAEGTRNELAPPHLCLAANAKALWVKFHDFLESHLGDGGNYAPIRAFASKAAEHAARLAGVLTLVDNIHAREIPLDKMAAGIELAKHYLSEALRLNLAAVADPDLELAERLLRWLQEQGRSHVWLAHIYQCGPSAIRDAKTAKRIVRILEEHHWLEDIDGGLKIDGQFRRDVWRVRV